jgi:DNA-binding MarR family transcriptional regulator
MAKHKDLLLEALTEGRPFTWTLPQGGDFASMRAVLKHGQTLTMSPIVDLQDVREGDIVCVKWHKGYIIHLVQEIQGNQFLIVNSVGKINGWVEGKDIFGRVSQIIEPEARPSVPMILNQLEEIYRQYIDRIQPPEDERERLLSIVEDLRWYAERIKSERWDELPRSNKWSFHQNVWRLTRQAKEPPITVEANLVCYLIDQGKKSIGFAAELYELFEYEDSEK